MGPRSYDEGKMERGRNKDPFSNFDYSNVQNSVSTPQNGTSQNRVNCKNSKNTVHKNIDNRENSTENYNHNRNNYDDNYNMKGGTERGQEKVSVMIMHYIFRSFIFPVVMSVLDWVCVFIRETIQRVDFVTHML
jgi:hypothetical protein